MMYEFLDRLISVALPRIRDFRGLNPDSFDSRGNYSMGVTEQGIFPEIDVDRIARVQGMDITFVIKSRSKKESYELLRLMGLPFKTEKG
jgi:large subunit ribosomal protein L5